MPKVKPGLPAGVLLTKEGKETASPPKCCRRRRVKFLAIPNHVSLCSLCSPCSPPARDLSELAPVRSSRFNALFASQSRSNLVKPNQATPPQDVQNSTFRVQGSRFLSTPERLHGPLCAITSPFSPPARDLSGLAPMRSSPFNDLTFQRFNAGLATALANASNLPHFDGLWFV
jgi:hypothetical protein